MNSNEIEWKQSPIPPWKKPAGCSVWLMMLYYSYAVVGRLSIEDRNGRKKKKGIRREQEQSSYRGKQQP